MSARRLIQIALLAVVAVTLVVVFRPQPQADLVEHEAQTASARYVAYYFHGDVRCDTCRSIEARAEAAVREGFAPRLAEGSLEWRVVNTDEPANAHFVEDFGLTHGTVVLVERDGGETLRYAPLDRVWELVHEEDEQFRDYVQAEVAAWVESGI